MLLYNWFFIYNGMVGNLYANLLGYFNGLFIMVWWVNF